MTEFSRAFVIGGWSEDLGYIESLAKAVSESGHSFVDSAEPITLAEARKIHDKFNREAARRVVITHSAGVLAVDNAGVIMTLNGPEPVSLAELISGAKAVSSNQAIGYEDGVPLAGPTNAVKELARHPSTLFTPLKLQKFSTVHKLIAHRDSFPGGRAYLAYDHDEYGFGAHGEVQLARKHDIAAYLLDGWHNQPMQHPTEAARNLYRAINELL